jgi:hypothetical protein
MFWIHGPSHLALPKSRLPLTLAYDKSQCDMGHSWEVTPTIRIPTLPPCNPTPTHTLSLPHSDIKPVLADYAPSHIYCCFPEPKSDFKVLYSSSDNEAIIVIHLFGMVSFPTVVLQSRKSWSALIMCKTHVLIR